MEERKDICEGYERDSVQQLDKLAKDKNERFPIYPLTYIQAVYDARTKERGLIPYCGNVTTCICLGWDRLGIPAYNCLSG